MIAKVLLIIVFVGVVSANHLYGIIGEAYHAPQPYRFGYQIKDKESAQHRHEESDGHGNVRGSYGYTDDKGQYREVHYVADKNGFRAQVKTNEAGTANQNPAHVDVKADPPQHHFSNHHIPHHDDIKLHHHIPHYQEANFHHIPKLEEIQFNQHVPHHQEEIKIHHHVPQHQFHHVPHHHEEIKIHHHVPQHQFHHVPHHHEDIKTPHHAFHHVPSHHEVKVEPFQVFKKDQPFAEHLGFNNFSPLHGFSYNPSAFHGYGKWPFQDSNIYGKQHSSWKDHKGFGKGNFGGFNAISGFDGDFVGQSSSHKDKYEEIMEKIKAYKKDGALSLLGRFKEHTDNYNNNIKNWKYGHGNFDF